MAQPRRSGLVWGGWGAGMIAAAGMLAWQRQRSKDAYDGIARGHGRIEAVQIDLAATAAGRTDQVLFSEGELVRAGQVVARTDTMTSRAQLRRAEAQRQQASGRRRRRRSIWRYGRGSTPS